MVRMETLVMLMVVLESDMVHMVLPLGIIWQEPVQLGIT